MSKVVTQLNQIQADANILYVAFHAYHWNVKGFQFFAIHNYTEEAYDAMSELFDDVAERAIQLGGKPLLCPKCFHETAKAPKELKDVYTAEEVTSLMLDAYKYLLGEFKKLNSYAEEASDYGTAAMAQEKMAEYEKTIWMLTSTLGK